VASTASSPIGAAGSTAPAKIGRDEATSDAPELEVREIDIPRPARGRTPRMLSLTLLDGTTLQLPAANRRQRADKGQAAAAPPVAPRALEHSPSNLRAGESQPPPPVGEQLTARDLVAALRAVSHGADADEILGENTRWEKMFAALLSLLLRKHLIADWEFIDEFKKI
jgi:hypothetical protein